MNPSFLITALLWLSVAGLAFAVAKRSSYWRLGRATAPGSFGVSNLFAIPKRYFVDLHHVVARDPYIAKTHVATAGGAIGALALVFINYGLAIYSPWLDKLIFLAALAMLVGAVFVWRRRAARTCRPACRAARGIRCPGCSARSRSASCCSCWCRPAQCRARSRCSARC